MKLKKLKRGAKLQAKYADGSKYAKTEGLDRFTGKVVLITTRGGNVALDANKEVELVNIKSKKYKTL